MADFETFAEREKQGWATVEKFDSYEDYFAPVSAVFADDMMRHVKLDGAEVLDLCCDHGDMTARLSDRFAAIYWWPLLESKFRMILTVISTRVAVLHSIGRSG